MSDSLRDALTKAFEQDVVPEDTAPAPEPTTPPAESTPEPVAEAAPAPQPDAVAPETPKEETKEPTKEPAKDAVQAVSTAPPVAEKPPASWKPEERAHWDKVPKELRATILRREKEVAQTLSATAEARKSAAELDKVLHPFKPLLEKYGVSASQAIGGLFATRAALEVGTPEQKAQLVANLVRQFNVDIDKLDQELVKPTSQQQAPQAPPPINVKAIPELAPLFTIAERLQQASAQKAEQAISEVSSLEHFETVKEDMADILESFTARGKTITVRQAYDRAVALHPDLTPQAPVRAPSPSEAAAILARSKNAASSINGAPKQAPAKTPDTLRGAIEAAFESR